MKQRFSTAATAFFISLTSTSHLSAQVSISENASQHFSQGVTELTSADPGHFKRALAEFQRAYKDSPAWQILGNLGIAADALHRDGEAIRAYERYLKEGAKQLGSEEIAEFQTDIARLRAGSATLLVHVSNGPLYLVDTSQDASGRAIVNRYGPFDSDTILRVRAGLHSLHAEREGFTAADWTGELIAGDREIPSFAMRSISHEPVAEANQILEKNSRQSVPSYVPSNAGAYWSWAIAGLGAAAGVGLYFQKSHLEEQSELDFGKFCGPDASIPFNDFDCSDRSKDLEAANYGTAAWASAGVSAVFLLTGAILYSATSSQPHTETADNQATFQAWLHPLGFGASGTF